MPPPAPRPAATHHDDLPVGQLLGRREALAALGALGCGVMLGCGAEEGAAGGARVSLPGGPEGAFADCVVRPAQTEGPFFVDGTAERSDLAADRRGKPDLGVPLALELRFALLGATVSALSGARIDIWQCDAQGRYSDEPGQGPGPVPVAANYLRGFQTSDAEGRVRFATVYPGWYSGRTVHIHVKARWGGAADHQSFTSQFYFDDALTDTVHANPAYAQLGQHRTRNAMDGIFTQGGDQLLLRPERVDAGYRAAFGFGMLCC